MSTFSLVLNENKINNGINSKIGTKSFYSRMKFDEMDEPRAV